MRRKRQMSRRDGSDTAQRIALMKRYLSVFEVSTINFLLADREFIGAQWLDFRNSQGPHRISGFVLPLRR